jgi:hypothetical protein
VTPRPDLGSVAEELYSKLAPYQTFSLDGREVTDEEMGWALLIYWGLIAKRWQPVEDLSRDTPEGPGWSILFDPDRIPDEGLTWLSQAVGVTLPPGMTTDQQRFRITHTGMDVAYTPSAIAAAAQRHLTGDKNVIINEFLAGNAKRIGVVTYTDETPSPEQTRLDIEEQLPWWLRLTHTIEDAWDYATIRTAFDDYAAIRSHFDVTGYLGIRSNDPPA